MRLLNVAELLTNTDDLVKSLVTFANPQKEIGDRGNVKTQL